MVLDLGLPDMTGFELLDEAQGHRLERDLPIIVYTGSDLTPKEDGGCAGCADSDHRQGRALARATARRDDALPAPAPRPSCPTTQRQMLQRGARLGAGARRQEGPGRRRRHPQHLRAHQRPREPPSRWCSSPRTARTAIELLEKHPDVDAGADGHHDAGDGRLRDDRAPSASFRHRRSADHRADRQGDEGRSARSASRPGASDYVAKPVDTERLLSLLRVWRTTRQPKWSR